MKANQSVSYDILPGRIVFHVKGQPDIVMDMGKVHDANINRAAYVGMAQVRIVDAAAVMRADKDGNLLPEPERLKMKHDRMKRLVDHFESGSPEWSPVQRAERADRSTDHTLTIRALCEMFPGKDVEAILARQMANLSITRTALLDSYAARDDVSRIIARYRAERSANVDTESLFDELTNAE